MLGMVKEKQFYKTLLFIAIPVAFQNLITFGVNMLDTVMVGSLGDTILSATASANQVSVFLMMFVRGISGGTALLISQYWGKKDTKRIKIIFGIGFSISFLISTIAATAVLLFPVAIISIFSNDVAVIAEGAKYLRIIASSYIFFAVSDTLISMLRCVEVVKIALIVSIVTFFVNVIGNYILIFGKFGFPQMGIEGAALATLIARFIEVAIVITYALKFDTRLKMKVREMIPTDKDLWRDFFRYGFPVMLGDVLWGFVGVIRFSILGKLGAAVVSGISINDVIFQLSTIFVFGLANAACVNVGKAVGVGDFARAKQYSKTIQILFIGVGIVAGLITYLSKDLVISLYNVSIEAQRYASQFITITSVTVLGTSYIAASFMGINRGGGDSRFVIKVDLFFGWLVILPLSALAAFVWHLSPAWVFTFSRIDQILKIFVAFPRLRKDKWIRNITRD